MQNTLKLSLEDLVPQEATFTLSTTRERVHTLKPYTLRVQLHAQQRFGEAKVVEAIQRSDMAVLVELAWFVLKDKKPFQDNYETFLDAIESYKDRQAVVDAMLTTAGLSQPVLEKIEKQLGAQSQGNESPSPSTGANSTTDSGQNTVTA